ncbi:putative lipid II flippase FtsW [Desulfovibrio litoralis]|uniref:Probable peptidoglycan glycosyltransferase FtsW n=1 Tax=Desulfovibrio litoralis DSM 11393 TaxID=1121455 RepID=A0A1M7SLJ6_9BACT|nr:putative lipid II flippase FtsW [Desulfovibrio litoralis]SHN59363.1 cell division protein FtsW [Desulfovibrio litoralis DSM 11393]
MSMFQNTFGASSSFSDSSHFVGVNSKAVSAWRSDYYLLGVALTLLGIGLMMVFSASGIRAELVYSNKYYFFERQALFALVSLIFMIIAWRMPRSILHGVHYFGLFISLVLLLLTLSPFGDEANGAQRWIGIGNFKVQPMEFVKIAMVFYLAYFLGSKQDIIKTFSRGIIPPFAITGLFCGLLLLQPDFGGAAVLAMLLFFMCLAGGTRFIYLFFSAMLALGGAAMLIVNSPYRARRLMSFVDPFKDASDSGYHVVQSLYALALGGWTGQGIGAGKQKLFYLPEAHNDFIVAVLGEEMGFVGICVVFLLLAIFFWRGLKIAVAQKDVRDKLAAFGLTLIVSISAVLNMAVIMSLVPPKGVPMPFLSYGGSSLLSTMLCVGFLLNYSRTARDES